MSSPVEFHYLFLDEIQDLPPVVPYLISQLFTDGLYFSGDSAQSIQKGISFRFSDLKFMFNKNFPLPPLNFKTPKEHALTVNFRSHNNILHLANSIVNMLK
jgi:superfamily I DNA/RNA helicase